MYKVPKKKERIEIQLDTDKDADLLQFIDENGTTRAGFIKFVVRHYMNSFEGIKKPLVPLKDENQIKDKDYKGKDTKKVPKLGQAFSSNDIE